MNLNSDFTTASFRGDYKGQPVMRVDCIGNQEGFCERKLGCAALVDTSRSDEAQTTDLKRGRFCDPMIGHMLTGAELEPVAVTVRLGSAEIANTTMPMTA